MKVKRILAAALSTCMLLACTVPAVAAPAPRRAERVIPITDTVTTPIPRNLLKSMKKDIEIGNFIRFITLRDISRFFDKMKELYSGFDTTAQTLDSSWDLAMMDSACSGAGNVGPIGVAPAQLNGEEITLVVLGGTQFVDGQATGIKEDLLSALEQSNDYLTNIVNLFYTKDKNGDPIIPDDKPVLVSGISLGGMVAQQLLAQEELMEDFDIQNIICFGSPLLAPEYRTDDTNVVRFCDTMDIVPYLGKTMLESILAEEILDKDPSDIMEELDAEEQILKDGGYKSPISAHTLSYVDGACWDGYDVLGEFNGSNEIEMLEDMTFFANPSLVPTLY